MFVLAIAKQHINNCLIFDPLQVCVMKSVSSFISVNDPIKYP